MIFPTWLCLHCLEEFPIAKGEPESTCPACIAEGHALKWAPRDGVCLACDREYYEALRALKEAPR